MPNWCTTEYAFYGETAVVQDFAKKIREYTDKEFYKSDFGALWLGNVVIGFGINTPEDFKKTTNVECRGEITSVPDWEEDLDEIHFFTWTAWHPMNEMWDRIIFKHYTDEDGYPQLFYSYLSEEPGNEYYEKSDSVGIFQEKYIISENGCDDYLYSNAELFERVKEIIKKDISSFEECKKCLENIEDVNVYKFNEV